MCVRVLFEWRAYHSLTGIRFYDFIWSGVLTRFGLLLYTTEYFVEVVFELILSEIQKAPRRD